MIGAQAITLFVDDAPSLLEVVKSRLSEIGYKAVEIASSIDEAMKIVATKRVSHVVSDWKMERPGGVEFLKRLRRENPSIRCTLLTGFIKDLTEIDRSVLADLKISIADKEQVSTAWLARLVGYNDYVSSFDFEEEVDMAAQEVVSGPADIIAQQRLRIEELERVLLCVSEDLIQDIECIKFTRGSGIIGGRAGMTPSDLVREIKSLSPLGRRLIELDRAAKQRLTKRGAS